MPTTRPRFQVTETPEIRRALDVAARAWPEASRSELVLRLFLRGAEAIDADAEQPRSRRRQAVDASAGSLDVAYEPDYLEKLRSEWPE
ncbi:hypothetical protein [Agromyces sp. H66]|uniref:hypothetical protein n=1 Tax=Agromyces sp. H66 TaxID=2529859 RepID=UPI00145AB440|nr:hypothetical protein [Agromyces sp. H66]